MLIRIATRRSKLALAQSRWVAARLEALHPGLTVELREYVTRGDRIQDVPLAQVGGKGLFTREIEEALLAGEADVAVHSLKDLPAELPPGLALACVPAREDPRDVLVLPLSESRTPSGEYRTWDEGLGQGARIGSSSLRRGAQLLHARPDLVVESVRGNVDTRLRKLDEGSTTRSSWRPRACAGWASKRGSRRRSPPTSARPRPARARWGWRAGRTTR